MTLVTLLLDGWTKSGPPRAYGSPEVPPEERRASTFFLLANESWNDFGYRTNFLVHTCVTGTWEVVGFTGIGFIGQRKPPGQLDAGGTTVVSSSTWHELGRPSELNELPDHFFSLGENLDFYKRLLTSVGIERARDFLTAVQDVAIDPRRNVQARFEDVFQVSLLRSSLAVEAFDKAALLFGGSASVRNAFDAAIHVPGAAAPHRFHFDFGNEAPVPSRINVLVGLNGTGKTQSMAGLARLISRVMTSTSERSLDVPEISDEISPRPSIYGVVAISFSAFDDFVIPDNKSETQQQFRYTYCGLRSLGNPSLMNRTEAVISEVRERFIDLSEADRFRALRPLLLTLDDDLDVPSVCASGQLPQDRLSAGQRIVLSAACEMVRNVRERTLVLMDEPETHLHPQLLASLMSWTAELLRETDSFAIVATHSPSVVQQIPAGAVHILVRTGRLPGVRRPAIETFGANLTDINNEVFQNREGDVGYQDVLQDLWDRHGSVGAVNELFGNRLGLNALMFLRSLEVR